MQRILFITSTRIGDAVINSGVLDHLGRIYPDAKFTIACGPLAVPILENTPQLERLIVLHKKPLGLHWPGLWRQVVATQWDRVVDMRGSAVAYLLRANERNVAGRYPYPDNKVREAANVIRAEPPPSPKIHVPADAYARALGHLPAERQMLAICPSASWPFKMWPADRFAELVRRLAGKGGPMAGAAVHIFGGPGDEEHAAPILRVLPDAGIVDFTGKLHLMDVAALLKRARLFVGNDSGVMHIAAAMGAPTLGLFGPSDERRYGPWGENCASVRGPRGFEECRELAQSRDFKSHPESLLLDLSTDAVYEAACRLLERTSQ
jgi:ADP-heptose:LPS heptosyltransferase